MDIIGALGYAGQRLLCLNNNKLGFHNGTGNFTLFVSLFCDVI